MICLSSAGGPAWFQIQKVYVSRYFQPKPTASTLNEFTLKNVTAALSVKPRGLTCRVQSTFIFNKRRVSLALWFGWGENETLKQACRLDSQSAPVAFKNLMTHGSAIRIAYRTSLRSSSLWEPRYPPLRIWFWIKSLVRLLCLIRFLRLQLLKSRS